MNAWENTQIFDGVDFSEIDEKVRYIDANRHICEETIRELNRRIDIDYVHASEDIENNLLTEIEKINVNDDLSVVYANAEHLEKLLTDENMIVSFSRTSNIEEDEQSLLFIKKLPGNKFSTYVQNVPKHLSALNDSLKTARQEKRQWQNGGGNAPLTREFIEKLHEELFSDYIFINTRLSRFSREPIKPAGYGKFRETISINGKPHKYNCEVEGGCWTPSDSDDVALDMQTLIDNYNNSNYHPILKAIIFKAQFVKIHPFRDGNGRMSRILLNYMLVKYGIPTITIKGSQRDRYFDAMHQAIVEENYTPLITLVKQRLNRRCDKYITIIDEYKKKLEDILNEEDLINE